MQVSQMSYNRRLSLAKAISKARNRGMNVRTVKWANGEMGIYSRKSYNSDMLPTPPPDDPKDFNEWWQQSWDADYTDKTPAIPKSMRLNRKERMNKTQQKGRRKGLDVNVRRRNAGMITDRTPSRISGVNSLLGENIFVRRGLFGNLPIELGQTGSYADTQSFSLFRGGETRPLEQLANSGMFGGEFTDTPLIDSAEDYIVDEEGIFSAEPNTEYYIKPLTPIHHFLIKRYGDSKASEDFTIGGGLEEHWNQSEFGEKDPRGGYYELMKDAPLGEDVWSEHLAFPAVIYGVSTSETEMSALDEGKEYGRFETDTDKLQIRRWIKRMSASNAERGGIQPKDAWHYRLWQTMKEAHMLSKGNPDVIYAIGDHPVYFDKNGVPLGWQDGTDYGNDEGDEDNVAVFYGGKMWNVSHVDMALSLGIWNDPSPTAEKIRLDFNSRFFGVDEDPGESNTPTGNMAFIEWFARREPYPPDKAKYAVDKNGDLHLDPAIDTKDVKRQVGTQTSEPNYLSQNYGGSYSGPIPYKKRLWNYQRFAFDQDMPDWVHGWEDKYLLNNDSVALNKKWDKQLAKDLKYSDYQGQMTANAIEDFIDKKSDFSRLPAAILSMPIGGSLWAGKTEQVGEIRRGWKSILGND